MRQTERNISFRIRKVLSGYGYGYISYPDKDTETETLFGSDKDTDTIYPDNIRFPYV